jgi:hypothetical protein
MSVHLYNLGADMNISNGLDRVGKVVFGALSLGALGSATLLLMGGTPSNLSESFASTTAAGFIAGCITMYRGGEPKHTLGACLLMAYSLILSIVVVNKVPDAHPYVYAIAHLIWAGIFFLIYLGLRKIAKYVFTGFTQKT